MFLNLIAAIIAGYNATPYVLAVEQFEHVHNHRNLREGQLRQRLGQFDDKSPYGLCKDEPKFTVGGETFECQAEFIQKGGRCKTPEPTEEEKKKLNEDFARWKKAKSNNGIGPGNKSERNLNGCDNCIDWDAQDIVIPVYFHIICDDDVGCDYYDVDAYTENQIKVLNTAFMGLASQDYDHEARSYSRFDQQYLETHIRFCLKGKDSENNSEWYEGNDVSSMKRYLRVGGMESLNVYVCGLSGGTLAFSSFPRSYDNDQDGIVLRNGCLPGGDVDRYNEGDTLTHEIGHWFGLYHTFQDKCRGPGDYMDYNPYQELESVSAHEKFASWGCPRFLDDCNQDRRYNPIHNFMAYTDDNCMDDWTPGQIERIQAFYELYRYKVDGIFYELDEDGIYCVVDNISTTFSTGAASTTLSAAVCVGEGEGCVDTSDCCPDLGLKCKGSRYGKTCKL